MKGLSNLRKIWTFEQNGTRAQQLNKYLVQVQQEMFNQSLYRNAIGAVTTLAVHYFFSPAISLGMLFSVAGVHIYSHKQFHKSNYEVLGYSSSQKHLLKPDYAFNTFSMPTHEHSEATTTGNPADMNSSIEEGQLRYVQTEHSQERMKHYNRTLICTGLLQGLFLGGTGTFWLGATPEVVFMTLTIAGNSLLNSFVFKYVYENSTSIPGVLKTHLLGTIIPGLLILVGPILFNNAFLQSNLLKQAQALFLLNQNIKQDPTTFLMHRRGIRIFGIIAFYLLTFLNLTEDPKDDEEEDEDENVDQDELEKQMNQMMKRYIRIEIKDEPINRKSKKTTTTNEVTVEERDTSSQSSNENNSS